MRYILGMTAMLAGLCVSSAAFAEKYVVKEARGTVMACYQQVYVPATVQYNTRGILAKRESVGWVVTGDRWEKVRSPAVYFETSKTVEPDHYKLVPCK
ncbi:hypothetical protein [Pinisolibacter aquiterrae]|uniref:hypothetical protein n=1 Tax=Pinisolibacter aquiterrae TaxID=2815579 RepID=UPI001C3D87BD|nr:hypothetical protein [Pinisolibacter aquiterrae]MBV5263445.1 hypothetical protein [Pinisolibacter aquiterrae]MCC8237478.1 hypothetical protein [Pinisolibacter aquiterrae]